MRAKGILDGLMQRAGEAARHALGHWRAGTIKYYIATNYDITLILPEKEETNHGHDHGQTTAQTATKQEKMPPEGKRPGKEMKPRTRKSNALG